MNQCCLCWSVLCNQCPIDGFVLIAVAALPTVTGGSPFRTCTHGVRCCASSALHHRICICACSSVVHASWPMCKKCCCCCRRTLLLLW